MEWGSVYSILDGNKWGLCAVQLRANACNEAILKMSDKWDTQVEASSKQKVNCTATSQLLTEVIGPTHLEAICSQKARGYVFTG